MDFSKTREIFDRISELQKLEVSVLLTDLIQSGKIDFSEIATLYVKRLEAENHRKHASIANLGLLLGFYAMTDTSDTGKAARKHLYESGAYGQNDGSVFGKLLDDEFKQ
jgi:hypothetical protein